MLERGNSIDSGELYVHENHASLWSHGDNASWYVEIKIFVTTPDEIA
jgi:hypothetical protein